MQFQMKVHANCVYGIYERVYKKLQVNFVDNNRLLESSLGELEAGNCGFRTKVDHFRDDVKMSTSIIKKRGTRSLSNQIPVSTSSLISLLVVFVRSFF